MGKVQDMIEAIRVTTEEYLMDISAITDEFTQTVTKIATEAATAGKAAADQFNQELKDRTTKYIADLKALNESNTGEPEPPTTEPPPVGGQGNRY